MRRTFCCLFHASDCCEEVECVVERIRPRVTAEGQGWVGASWMFCDTYRLVSYPASCKCGRPVPHSDPPQEELRRAWHHPEAEDA